MEEKYKEYRDKWDKYPKEFVQDRVPLHIDLEITTRCNYKCIMCYQSFDPPKPMDMKLDLAKKIIDEFGSKGGCAIKYCYLGEPMLYPHLVELVRYSKEKGVVDTRIATNGSLLTEKISKGLIEAGLDLMIFSVDSMFPQIYEQIRIGGKLSRVIKNILTLKQIREELVRSNPKIQIQAIPMEINKQELESKIYNKFYKVLADIVWISPWCKDFSNVYTAEDIQPEFFCPAPYRRLLIRADGEIWLCCGDLLKEKFIGIFPEMSIEEAWNGKYMKDVRENLNNGNVHLIPACKKCSERYYKQ